MSLGFIISLIIPLIIAGFVAWAARKIVAVLPLDALVKSVIDVVIIVVVAAIVIFGVAIPLLNALAGVHLPTIRMGDAGGYSSTTSIALATW